MSCQPTYLGPYLLTWIPTCLPGYLPAYLDTYLLTWIPTYLPGYLPTYLDTQLPTRVPSYLDTYLLFWVPTYLPGYLPTYLPTSKGSFLPVFLPTYLDTYLQRYHLTCVPILLAYLLTWVPTSSDISSKLISIESSFIRFLPTTDDKIRRINSKNGKSFLPFFLPKTATTATAN